MSLIPRLSIAISGDVRPLASQLAVASKGVTTFANMVSAPLKLNMDLSRVREQTAKATEIIGEAGGGISTELAASAFVPKITASAAAASIGAAGIGAAINAAGVRLATFQRQIAVPAPLNLDITPVKQAVAQAVVIGKQGAKVLAANWVTRKVGPRLGVPEASPALTAGKIAVDAAVPHVVTIGFKVARKALELDLALTQGLVRGSITVMKKLAVLPITATSFGVSVGLAAAENMLLPWVQKKTGWGTVELLARYAKLKVGLGVAGVMVRTSTRMMASAAVFPIRVSFGLLKAGLARARSMVSAAIRSMGSLGGGGVGGGIGLGGGGIGLSGMLGLAAAAFGATRFLGAGVKSAMNLNETLSKTGEVFGQSTAMVTAQADQMAKSFGLPKGAILDAASSIGLIARGAGQSNAQAATLANNMARLAADASSFYNVPLETSLDKIRSGLVGESEPLRAFGVLLSEDAVKAEAVGLGLAMAGKKLDEMTKVAARASLIQKGLSTASGDLARTSTSASNQFRNLSGGLSNFATSIGQSLLPAVQFATGVFTEFLGAASMAFEDFKPVLAQYVAGVSAAFDRAAAVIRNSGLYWEMFQLKAMESFANVVAVAETIPANFSIIGHYVAENWVKLIGDGVRAAGAFINNLGTNIGELAYSIAAFLKDPTQGFTFNFTPLLAGFKATADQLPQLIQPALISLQDKIDAKSAEIAARELQRSQALSAAVAPKGSAAPFAKAAAVGDKLKLAGLAERGSKEDYSAISRFFAGGAKPDEKVAKLAGQQLQVQQKQLAELQKLANRAGGDGAALPVFAL